MSYYEKEEGGGSISEWNEGNLKNFRLHEYKEMIAEGKEYGFERMPDRNKFGYQVWLIGILNLYGEGSSKYSDEEKQQATLLKKFVEAVIEFNPPFKKIHEFNVGGRVSKLIPNAKNQKKIKEALEKFEELIKDYNDKHGLDTRNRDDMDDGL